MILPARLRFSLTGGKVTRHPWGRRRGEGGWLVGFIGREKLCVRDLHPSALTAHVCLRSLSPPPTTMTQAEKRLNTAEGGIKSPGTHSRKGGRCARARDAALHENTKTKSSSYATEGDFMTPRRCRHSPPVHMKKRRRDGRHKIKTGRRGQR